MRVQASAEMIWLPSECLSKPANCVIDHGRADAPVPLRYLDINAHERRSW